MSNEPYSAIRAIAEELAAVTADYYGEPIPTDDDGMVVLTAEQRLDGERASTMPGPEAVGPAIPISSELLMEMISSELLMEMKGQVVEIINDGVRKMYEVVEVDTGQFGVAFDLRNVDPAS